MLLRIEIGAKDVARKVVVLADHDNQVKHHTGRMIATRKSVPIDGVAAAVQVAVDASKAKHGSKKGSKPAPGANGGSSLFDLLPALTPSDEAALKA